MTEQDFTNGLLEENGPRRWPFVMMMLVLAVALTGGVVVWAITSNREDIDTNSVAIQRADAALEQIAIEGNERRDQTCALFERDHLGDIARLKVAYRGLLGTYQYIREATPSERQSVIYRLIRSGLPQRERDVRTVEREARQDRAPDFCDKPGVGLPEPDPRIPRRPKSLR